MQKCSKSKKSRFVDALSVAYAGILFLLIGIVLMVKYNDSIYNFKVDILNKIKTQDEIEENKTYNTVSSIVDAVSYEMPTIVLREEVYNGMTIEELASKLDKSLTGFLSGTGYIYASKSIELGVDPYIAVAITLHETGCNGYCSTLTTKCYNVGGIKGNPSCGASGYARYNSLEEGITSFIKLLANGYFSKGLTTPETIGPRYAGSPTWASAINNYVNQIASK